jgi:hypothetical protein
MKIHIVRSGEAFEELVQKYNVPFERLLEANPHLDDHALLEPGSKVRIPTGKVPVSTPREAEEEALVEELTPIFLEPVDLEEPDLSWELDTDWDDDDDEFEEDEDEDFSSIAGPFAPMYPTEAAFQPYFSTSGFEPLPILPYPIYPPPVYPPSVYPPTPFYGSKKESSSTVY